LDISTIDYTYYNNWSRKVLRLQNQYSSYWFW